MKPLVSCLICRGNCGICDGLCRSACSRSRWGSTIMMSLHCSGSHVLIRVKHLLIWRGCIKMQKYLPMLWSYKLTYTVMHVELYRNYMWHLIERLSVSAGYYFEIRSICAIRINTQVSYTRTRTHINDGNIKWSNIVNIHLILSFIVAVFSLIVLMSRKSQIWGARVVWFKMIQNSGAKKHLSWYVLIYFCEWVSVQWFNL